MIKVVCSVFDSKAAAYSNPFYSPNNAVATRDFLHAATDPQSAMFRNPEDFSLYQVATFDDDSGLFAPVVPPMFISSATKSE
jgi:hypothetical protein